MKTIKLLIAHKKALMQKASSLTFNRYIENETLIVNNIIIHQIAPGKGHIASSICDKDATICHCHIFLVSDGVADVVQM